MIYVRRQKKVRHRRWGVLDISRRSHNFAPFASASGFGRLGEPELPPRELFVALSWDAYLEIARRLQGRRDSLARIQQVSLSYAWDALNMHQ